MKLSRVVIAIWVFFWIFFLVRGFYKGEFEEFRSLVGKSPQERKVYTIGEDLHNFLEFSLKNISEEGTYKLAGKIEPMDRYRLIYYLYPRRESDNPEYILCYEHDETFSQRGFHKSAVLKDDQFILKRRVR